MCDGYSFLSAGADLAGGIAGMIDGNSRADFASAQADIMSVFAGAQASLDEADLRRSFREQTSQNVAAAAVSGLDQGSFESIAKGNQKDMKRNIATIQGNLKTQKAGIKAQGAMAALEARLEGRASLFSGLNSGMFTLAEAEKEYQKNHTGQTRREYARESIGGSFFARKGK